MTFTNELKIDANTSMLTNCCFRVPYYFLNAELHELVGNYLANSISRNLIVHRSKHDILESSNKNCRFNHKEKGNNRS